jgi:hypothetical protein
MQNMDKKQPAKSMRLTSLPVSLKSLQEESQKGCGTQAFPRLREGLGY